MEQQAFEIKMKHLDMIQAIITRMNANSFSMKGWGGQLLQRSLQSFISSQ